MTFKTAREIFEKAQVIALNDGEEVTEGIAAGLIELTKALAITLKHMEDKINSLEREVRHLR